MNNSAEHDDAGVSAGRSSNSVLPSRLFKYTDHHGTEILRDLRLKVTPPIECNDVFEMTPCLKPGVVTPEHILDVIRNTPPADLYNEMKAGGETLPPFEIFVKLASDVPPERLIDAAKQFQTAYEHLAVTQPELISKSLGLVCLTERENDLLMWAHYTDSHRGLLVEFDTSHRYFQDNSRFEKVSYCDGRPPFDPTLSEDSPEENEQCRRILFTKHSTWIYELEWRSLFPLAPCHKKQLTDPERTLYFTDIPPELIKRVVLGERCPPKIEEQVRDARRHNRMNFALCRAVADNVTHRLNYVPV